MDFTIFIKEKIEKKMEWIGMEYREFGVFSKFNYSNFMENSPGLTLIILIFV